MKVLIADDDRVLTLLVASRLRGLGWAVEIAADAMQAMMFALRTQPDVIVLDIQMPGGTGIQALQKLKSSVRTSQIPVLVLSGSVEPGTESLLLDLGAAAFVRKPVDVPVLHEMLTNLVSATPGPPGAGRA